MEQAMTSQNELKPDEARAALESVEAMRRAGVHTASVMHPALLALAAALAFAYCAAPPFLGEYTRDVSSLLFLALLFLPALGYWGLSARPRFGRSDGTVFFIMLAFTLGMGLVQGFGGLAYRQGHAFAPFIAGAVGAVVYLVGFHFMTKRTREALAEQDRELLAQGGSERPNFWYVPMGLIVAGFSPAAWGGALPPLSILIGIGLSIGFAAFRVATPGWPRRPMAEEWIAFALYAAINVIVVLLVREQIVPRSAAWFLAAPPSFIVFLTCYGLARRRLLAAMGEHA